MKFEYKTDHLLTDKEVATLFGVSVALLKRWRCYGGGPVYIKVGGPRGRAVRYRQCDLERWVTANAIAMAPNGQTSRLGT